MSLKRPLVHDIARPNSARRAFSADGRILSKIKPFFSSRTFSHTSAWTRALCTKTEGAVEPGEQVKKDDKVQEAATDK